MKKFLLLTTGGTIASQAGENGLTPQMDAAGLLHYVQQLKDLYQIETEALLNLDSSNIQPEEWQMIARRIFVDLAYYDGFIITHGTDTMAYTASMLAYMLQNIDKPVILTGSQIPIDSHLTDARVNLYCAFAAADSGRAGVYVVFNRKIIYATRAVKVRTMGFDAFESVNMPDVGEVRSDGILWHSEPSKNNGEPMLYDKLESNIFLLKLIPGTRPEIFDHIVNMKYSGVVIEAFGAGGLHHIRRDLLEKLKLLEQNQIVVVACSQCLYEHCDFSVYEVGQKLLTLTNVIPAYDMTTESCVTKLMWALGQSHDVKKVKNIFSRCYCDEIDLKYL